MVPVGVGVGFQVREYTGPSLVGVPSRGPSAVPVHSQPVVFLRCGTVLPRPWPPTSVSPPPPGPVLGPGPRLQSFLGSKGCQRAGGWAGPLPRGYSCCSLVETILSAVSCVHPCAVSGSVATAQPAVPRHHAPSPLLLFPSRVYPGPGSPSGPKALPLEPQSQPTVLPSDRVRVQGHSGPRVHLLLIGPTGQWRCRP